MAARLDPEDLRRVLRPFFDAMTREIERFGGTVEKFIGDAVVAFFGVPVAHEDDPQRAVRAGLAMQERLISLNDEVAETAGGDLAMRIGINTGEVFAHGGGSDEGFVTGEAVNIAARFQALAAPGSVVVGERTYRDAGRVIAFRPLGELSVKGIDRPLTAWEALGEKVSGPGATQGAGGLLSPIVGRDHELELLRLLFSRTVRERRPNLVTVVGAPGIGKSRLSHEFATSVAAEEDALLVRGRCLPYGEGLTYWPLAEILKADAGILDSDPPSLMLDKARARLDPKFGGGEEGMATTSVLLSAIGVAVGSDPLAGAEPAAAQRLITRAWQRYLESMTSERPVLALIEDIHWADPSLLDLIETCASKASGPALILCMARPELSEKRPGWGGGLSNATTISLSPLSAGEGTALIEHFLGGEAPAEVVGPILHRSEGNPFFAGELLRMMTEDGTLARKDGSWALTAEMPSALPDTVQGVIASRIDLLAPAEKRAIQDAAVVGRIFWQGAIERLGSQGAAGAVDALIDKGLLWERETSSIEGERELIFNHILTRDVAYANIPRARRTEAHEAVGGWLEAVTRGRDEEFAEILAYHFAEAGDAAKTARAAMLAGHRHRRIFAAEEAIRWYDRALEAAVDGTDDALRSEIALARGQSQEQIGEHISARIDYERALGSARDAGDGKLEARALVTLAHLHWLADRYDEGQALLPVALEKARAIGATDLEARLLYTAGTIQFGRGAFRDALPFHDDALEVATRSGDAEGQALAHHGICEAYFFLGPFERGLDHALQADRLLRELGQRPMVSHNEYMIAWLQWFVGRWDEAIATVESSVAGAREIGNRRDEVFALNCRAEVKLSGGDLGGAAVDADRSVEIARSIVAPRGEMIGRLVRGNVLEELGAFDRLAEDAAAALELSTSLGGTFMRALALAHSGRLALRAGDRAEGVRSFEEADRAVSARLEFAWSSRPQVFAWEEAHEPERLDAIGGRIEETLLAESPTWGVWGLYAKARAAAFREGWEMALELATRAVEIASSAGERRAHWRSLAAQAEALEALGRKETAAERRAEAARILSLEAASVTDPGSRASFVARSDVAALLA